jgi:hypothetical protein
MPELQDVVVYLEHLRDRILGQTLERVHLKRPVPETSVAKQAGDCFSDRYPPR